MSPPKPWLNVRFYPLQVALLLLLIVAVVLPRTACVVAATATTTTTCYFNNGDEDPDGHPCDTDSVANGGHSSCCHANDVCWSDGSCSTYGGNIPYWMSCTDQSWSDSACATIGCSGQVASNAETWLSKCYAYNGTSCCLRGPDTCCDDSSSKFFTYEPGSVVALLDSSGINTFVTSSSTSTSTSSSSSSSSSSATATDQTEVNSSDSTTTTKTTTAATSSSSSSSSSSPTSSSSSQNHTTTAEIALGTVMGVVATAAVLGLTALGVKLRSEKGRRQRAEAELDRVLHGGAPSSANNNNNKSYHHYAMMNSQYPPMELPGAPESHEIGDIPPRS